MNTTKNFPRYLLIAFALVALCNISFGCAHFAATGSDVAWWADTEAGEIKSYKGVAKYSEYLTMPDGVKIAVSVYIPKNLESKDRIPTVLHQTRYFREVEFRWPAEYLAGQPEDESIQRFTAAGYAFVNVDVRGSGASYGTRPYPWHRNEITDGAAVVDWIISQPWSNGKVGTTGVSYAGTTAEFLLVNKHPAVKAAVPRFALFDVYSDIVMPGGIYSEWFTKTWDKVNLALDSNRPGDALGWLTEKAAIGVAPVDADVDHTLLKKAVEGHSDNYRPHHLASQVTFRDDRDEYDFDMDGFSPYSYMEQIDQSDAAVYSYSGWFDGAYSHAAIKRHMNLKNPKNKLVLGPWPHDGYWKLEPFSFTKRARFDQVGEAMRFFDYHLKGIDRGIKSEAPIHYYTMGEEKWKTAKVWPPPDTKFIDYYLSQNNILDTEKPIIKKAKDYYKVDLLATTGQTTRWVSLVNLKNVRIAYPDRKSQDNKLLYYDTKPLAKELEVTGHPVVTLYVTSDKTDSQFFVYLEDIDPSGRVSYVTEGMLRAIHRKLSDKEPPYKMAVPYRTFKKEDAMHLVPGDVAELKFDLLPVSYLFKQGHKIRIAIAGADKDNFVAPEGAPASLLFHRNAVNASKITLPTIPRD